MKILVRRYDSSLFSEWSGVLAASRNGIFLFDRNYIEYHSDRFTDISAIAFLDGEPVALLPASIDMASSTASSHAGLTFGGVVLVREVRGDVAIALTDAFLNALKEWGAETLTVKPMPQVFCSYPSAEVEYALWRRGFAVVRRDLSSILPLFNSIKFNTSKLHSIRKAKKAGVVVGRGELQGFHALLEQVLQSKHGVAPVHSLKEMEYLMSKFPERIFVRHAKMDGELLAGAIVYDYGHVWHTQYLAASEHGRSLGALDLVIESVIEEAKAKNINYLSFGVSTESAGTVLNEGLLWQKESYGARSVVHDFIHGVL